MDLERGNQIFGFCEVFKNRCLHDRLIYRSPEMSTHGIPRPSFTPKLPHHAVVKVTVSWKTIIWPFFQNQFHIDQSDLHDHNIHPDSRTSLDLCLANKVPYVGPQYAFNIGPTAICSSALNRTNLLAYCWANVTDNSGHYWATVFF